MIVEAILEYSISPHLDLLFFYFDAFSKGRVVRLVFRSR